MCLSRTRIRTRRPTEDSIDASATTRARTCGTHAHTHTHTHTHTPHQQNACLLGSPLVDAGHHVALEKPLTLVSARGRVCLDHRRCVFDACTNACACTAGVSASGLRTHIRARAFPRFPSRASASTVLLSARPAAAAPSCCKSVTWASSMSAPLPSPAPRAAAAADLRSTLLAAFAIACACAALGWRAVEREREGSTRVSEGACATWRCGLPLHCTRA